MENDVDPEGTFVANSPTAAQRASFDARLQRRRGFVLQETPDIAAARAYGVDVGLLVESYFATPEERLRRNDEIVALRSIAVRHQHQSSAAWLAERRARRGGR